jgi:hypothetical protein
LLRRRRTSRGKLAKLASELQRLKAIEKEMLASPDQQISLTDPDSRSMAASGRGSGMVGYNVQVAVDTEHHLIVTHEVTNTGSDRSQLAKMASQAARHSDRLRPARPVFYGRWRHHLRELDEERRGFWRSWVTMTVPDSRIPDT